MFGAGSSRKEVIARSVAAAIAGASPVAIPFQAAGQQVANLSAACSRYTDPASQAQCAANERLQRANQRIDEANSGIATAERLKECISFLGQRKAAGITLDASRLTREKVCQYASDLGFRPAPGG